LALAALMLTTALLAALAWVLALLVGVVPAALLLARLVLVALVLLSALVRIVSHYLRFLSKVTRHNTTVGLSTGSD
jgi:hypothetical protein